MSDKFNILVVEDDTTTGKVICFELKAKGYNSRHFGNAEEALVFFRQNPDDLPVFVLSRESPDSDLFDLNMDSTLALPDRLTAIERNILENTLKRHNYHQTNAARELGISEARLRYKIRTLGIPRMNKNGESR